MDSSMIRLLRRFFCTGMYVMSAGSAPRRWQTGRKALRPSCSSPRWRRCNPSWSSAVTVKPKGGLRVDLAHHGPAQQPAGGGPVQGGKPTTQLSDEAIKPLIYPGGGPFACSHPHTHAQNLREAGQCRSERLPCLSPARTQYSREARQRRPEGPLPRSYLSPYYPYSPLHAQYSRETGQRRP